MNCIYLYSGLLYKTSLFFFWLHHAAYGILVPQPGIEPTPPAMEVWSLNHWIAREVPKAWLEVCGHTLRNISMS